MKKLITLLLAMSLLLSAFCGCGDTGTQPTPTDNTSATESASATKEPEGTEEKRETVSSSTFAYAAQFSEGLAFVRLTQKDKKLTCINKKGEIMFEAEVAEPLLPTSVFANGLALAGKDLYDKTGKKTSPEDVGATKFFDFALSEGYIVAEKLTADYSGTKKEAGIMNTSFEWVVEPSEEFHNTLTELDRNLSFSSYCVALNGFCCFTDMNKALNLKTGEVTDIQSSPLASAPELWSTYSDYTYRSSYDTVKIDLSSHNNITNTSPFENGTASVRFRNPDTGINYFTLINEKGEFLFEPVDAGTLTIKDVKVVNNKIYVCSVDSKNSLVGYITEISVYDMNGKKEGSYAVDKAQEYISIDISDGTILLSGSKKANFFTTDLKPLF